MSVTRWALFLSGRGSTAQAVMDMQSEIDIRLVVSSKASAYGLVRARRMGIPTMVLPKVINWNLINERLRSIGIEKIFLLGFMKIIPADFVNQWQGRIFNVHPSLLPNYPGLQAIEKSYSDGADIGVTIHSVTPGMDEGPILLQKTVYKKTKNQQSKINFESIQIKISFCEQQLIRKAVGIIK